MTLFAAKTKRQAEPAEPQTKPRRKLTRAERKQIEAAIARANRTGKKEQSAQDSIPYERMWPDGICKVADGRYTKTIQFQDINYQLSQNEDKTAIFEGWCDFLNYFDSSIRFQLSFLNLAASQETFANSITIPAQGDDFDPIRVEYTQMLQNQLARGNNGLIKTKYLTFSIEADSIRSAKPRLERIETDVLNNFKRLGVAAEVLDGKARLAQLHAIFHMDEQAPLQEITAGIEQGIKELFKSDKYRRYLSVMSRFHIQPCDAGYDYTIYDKDTMRALDGGQLDAPELPLSTAALKICEMHGMGGQSIRYAPLSMIETLQEAAVQQMQAAAQAAVPEVTQLPDAPEQALDEYPMPDPALTQDDLEKCGYLDGDLLPLSKERAYELMAQELTVYMVQQGENPAMAFDTADLDAHDGIFAVTREEWEESPAFDTQVMDRMDHQQEREQAFLNHKGDCYAIYQVKHTDELRDIRYEGLEWVKSIGRTVQRDNYDLVYTAPLTPGDLKGSVLDNLEYRFNNEHPADYRHPSMSVSDIVAIKRDGKVSCHYCDSFGFAEVPGFLPDNPLKSAEMTVEDDYGMIDGVINNGPKEPTVAQLEQQVRSGQPISLMDLAAAAHREDRDKKKSVMGQLKSQPKSEHKKTAPKKSAEREI